MKAVKSQKKAVGSKQKAGKMGLLIAFCLLLSAYCFLPTAHTAEVTRAQIDEVGKELACLCGTCPRRPLDECTCGHAQQQRGRIDSMLASGQNPQAVIDAYVNEFGIEVLSTPPAEGFNLMAWFMPPLVFIFGFFVVRSVLRSWSQTQPVATVPQTAQNESADPYLDRLESELRERDT